MLQTDELAIMSGEQRLAATQVSSAGGRKPAILTLHGLGKTATRHTIRYVLDDLAGQGHASICFEFSGNGDSTGALEEATLRRRRDEALAVSRYLAPGEQPVLIGTSMGGHLACWLAPVLRPRGLVLFCPAAYPGDAADQKFDGSLARPGCYADSPAYAGIAEFTGDLLIVGARNDAVVPAEVLDGYFARAKHARTRRLIWLDDCDHFIHRWLPHQEALRDEVLRAILQVVSGSAGKP